MWTLNVFLYLNFLFNPAGYKYLVSAGEPCMSNVTVNGQTSTDPQPGCPYDPSNQNVFVAYGR